MPSLADLLAALRTPPDPAPVQPTGLAASLSQPATVNPNMQRQMGLARLLQQQANTPEPSQLAQYNQTYPTTWTGGLANLAQNYGAMPTDTPEDRAKKSLNWALSIGPQITKSEIRSGAEDLAEKLKGLGFEAKVDHSGSAAGPSSYVHVYDPQTGRWIIDPARFSGHSKGPFNSQFVHEMTDTSSPQKIIDMAMDMRAKEPSPMMKKAPEAEQAAMQIRYKNAMKKMAKGKSLTISEQEAVKILERK